MWAHQKCYDVDDEWLDFEAKAWTFEAKATGAKAKAKTIKIGLEAPRGQGLASRTTSLIKRRHIRIITKLNDIRPIWKVLYK